MCEWEKDVWRQRHRFKANRCGLGQPAELPEPENQVGKADVNRGSAFAAGTG